MARMGVSGWRDWQFRTITTQEIQTFEYKSYHQKGKTMANTIWHEVTLIDGTKVLVNFDQVIAISVLDSGSKLITAAGDFEIQESLDDIQAALPI